MGVGVGAENTPGMGLLDVEADKYRSSAGDQAFYPPLLKDVGDIGDALFKRGVVVDKEVC